MQAILPDNAEERTLLALLSHDPRHVDELIRESGLPTMPVTATLTMMELKGMIRQLGSPSWSCSICPRFSHLVKLSPKLG